MIPPLRVAAVAALTSALMLSPLVGSATEPIPAPATAPAPPAAPLAAKGEVQGPTDGSFLIEGIRIWNGGSVSEPQDVLIRDGWVAAIGADADAQAPASARRIQAEEDWVVYPGLIHADYSASFYPAPENPYTIKVTDPRTGPVPNMELGTTANLRGWSFAADQLAWEPDAADAWREAGFTLAHMVSSERGLMRGRSATVSLNALPLGEALLKRDGFQVYSLRGARGGYPGTPMASLAMLRQVFLDASLAESGTMRRSADASFGELGPAIFLANGRREIENFLDLRAEFAPELPAMILGGRDAMYFADRLKEQNVSVLYIAGFGEAPKSDEDLKVEPLEERPYWQEPAQLREAARAMHAIQVSEFAALREAGVACALVPGNSASDWKDAW